MLHQFYAKAICIGCSENQAVCRRYDLCYPFGVIYFILVWLYLICLLYKKAYLQRKQCHKSGLKQRLLPKERVTNVIFDIFIWNELFPFVDACLMKRPSNPNIFIHLGIINYMYLKDMHWRRIYSQLYPIESISGHSL